MNLFAEPPHTPHPSAQPTSQTFIQLAIKERVVFILVKERVVFILVSEWKEDVQVLS